MYLLYSRLNLYVRFGLIPHSKDTQTFTKFCGVVASTFYLSTLLDSWDKKHV